MEQQIDNAESKNKYINSNKKIIESVNNKISSLEIEYNDSINNKKEIISLKEDEIIKKSKDIEDKNIIINALKNDLKEKEFSLTRLEKEINELKKGYEKKLSDLDYENIKLCNSLLNCYIDIKEKDPNHYLLEGIHKLIKIQKSGNIYSACGGKVATTVLKPIYVLPPKN